jgi:anti-anti-sigma regulatory factor
MIFPPIQEVTMPIHVRFDGGIVILSNVGRTMNDPRYVDAAQEVRDLLSEGFKLFVVELRGVGEPSSPLLGLLVTMTRQVRKAGGELVLAGMSRDVEQFLGEMRMEEFWDVFRNVEEAKRQLLQADRGP